jgi:hypothetical protein
MGQQRAIWLLLGAPRPVQARIRRQRIRTDADGTTTNLRGYLRTGELRYVHTPVSSPVLRGRCAGGAFQ